MTDKNSDTAQYKKRQAHNVKLGTTKWVNDACFSATDITVAAHTGKIKVYGSRSLAEFIKDALLKFSPTYEDETGDFEDPPEIDRTYNVTHPNWDKS